MARKKKPLAKRFRSQVRAESQLRFDPEVQAIRDTERDVRAQARGDVRVAKSSAKTATAAAKAAMPVANKSLSDAMRMVSTGPSPEVATSALGAAASRDADGARRRVAETKSQLDTELVSRTQDAESGKNAAIRNARSTQASELGKLGSRLQSVARQRGAFSQGRTGELTEAARARGVTRRGQDVTRRNAKDRVGESQADRQSREKIAADKIAADKQKGGKKNGVKAATPQQVIDATSSIDVARRQAKRAKADGEGRSGAAKLLVEGQKPLKDPKSGQEIPDTKYEKVKQLWASVALDLEYGRGISASNRARLHSLGYSFKALGLPTNAKPGIKRPGNAPSRPGSKQQRPT